ncbi:MAG: hypothetical protein HGA80_05680 [Candidatus Omnitrophica bacterium]|nr:hypothetical protein [Candidatus Omnitrophota bacterium]
MASLKELWARISAGWTARRDLSGVRRLFRMDCLFVENACNFTAGWKIDRCLICLTLAAVLGLTACTPLVRRLKADHITLISNIGPY